MSPSDSASSRDNTWRENWESASGFSSPTRLHSPPHIGRISKPGRSSYSAEQYELSPNLEEWSRSAHRHRLRPHYREGDTIDWWHEDASERERWKSMVSQHGLRGLLSPLMDVTKLWFIIIFTGICVGLAGGWLDILVMWLSGLREGRCARGFLWNQIECCAGVEPGEVCHDWQSWGEYFGISSILGQSLLHSFAYISLSTAFAASAAVLVISYAPYAFHTGIPEIKAILGGYPWTLLIKALGLALSVSSGLSLGKEGPLVHVSCCMSFLFMKLFSTFHGNEVRKRKILAAAAVAGVSVAFGSPLGGVLFGLEELDAFGGDFDVMWRGFVTSVIAAVALQYVDPFKTSKLVLFQVTNGSETWLAFELIPWLCLSVIGGVLGSLLIKLNIAAAVYRRNSILHELPIIEITGAAAVTAAVSYLVVFLRVPSSDLVANLFQECDPQRIDFHGLCNPTAMWENVFLLVLTGVVKIGFTAWTFGMMVPAGIFLPTIAIGATFGRAVGLLTQGLYRAYPKAWFFSACSPDPTVRCIYPGFYAVIGASSMLAGVTRMTVSLVVIVFELTGALSHVLPIMISVMISKWVADALGPDGIYASWIALRRYPWLAPFEFRDNGEIAADAMTHVSNLVVLNEVSSLGELKRVLNTWEYHGFPVVRNGTLLGYVAREKLKSFLEPLLDGSGGETRIGHFSGAQDGETADLSPLLEDAMQLRKEVPLELVVNMFRKLNLRHIMFSQAGALTGMITKTDIVALSTAHFEHRGVLAVERTSTG
ncbi:Cl-channel protein [Multifurca ochricompacta]|uniref:Cl-channel protein n=1 Tax=Multifurca ochricompacta TaxID=376703 RepID=A0AAD4M950_9AGAM|nr:Cl-channel protein [Multifurca ochricompacta]